MHADPFVRFLRTVGVAVTRLADELDAMPSAPALPVQLPAATNDDETLDARAAAKLIGWTEATLAAKRSRGGGPEFRKAGRKVLYSAAAIRAWQEQQTRRHTGDDGTMRLTG